MMAKLSMTDATGNQNGAVRRSVVGQDGLLHREFPGIGSVETVRGEIDDALHQMREFHQMEPDEVMRVVSGQSARLVELRVQVQRLEASFPFWKQVRTREVEPVLKALEDQFQIASRLITVRQLDYEMSRGQPG